MTGAPSDDTHTAPQDEKPTVRASGAQKPRHRGWGRALRIGAGVLVVLLGVFATHPWWLARVWAGRLAADSGREVRIDRMAIGLADGGIGITLLGVYVANAPWAGTAKPMAALREATFVLRWDTLFAERKDVARLVLVDGRVDLRRHADGRRNWRLRNPDDVGPGRYRILALEPHGVALDFEHRGVDLALAATATDVAAVAPVGGAAPATTMRVEIQGAWRGVPMAYALDTGPVLTFAGTGTAFPMRGTAEIGGLAVRIDGTAGDLFREPLFDADLEVAGRSLGALAPFIGERWPGARPFRVAGRFTAKEGRFALARAEATVGSTDLAGDLAWTRSADAPTATAALSSRRADWSDLAWLLGRTAPAARRAAQQAKADAQSSKRGGALLPTAAASAASKPPATAASAVEALERPDSRERLARWKAELRYEAAALHVAALPQVQRLRITAGLENGVLAVPSFEVGIAGGRLQGKATARLAEPTPSASVELQASGFRLERLIESRKAGADGKPRATGAVSGQASLAASGRTGEAMLGSLRGRIALELRQGSMSGLLDAQLGLSPGRIVRRMVGGDEAIALPCAHAALDVQGRTARIASLVVASQSTRTSGRGSIDLDRRTLDVTLTPVPVGGGGWLDLDRSIRLTGPLAKPDKQLVERVGIDSKGC
jgi:hypothetical protein